MDDRASDDEDDELERLFQAGAHAHGHVLSSCADQRNHPLLNRPSLASLGSLPEECVYNILIRTLSAKAVCRAAEVCRRFREFCKSERIWRVLFDERWGLPSEYRRNEHPLSSGSRADREMRTEYEHWTAVDSNWKQGKFTVRSLEGHSGGVCSVQLHAKTLVSAGEDGTIRWWDLDTLNCAWSEAKAHAGPIWCLRMLGDNIVTSSSDGCVKRWTLTSCLDSAQTSPMECSQVFRGHVKGEIWSCDLDRYNVFSGGRDCSIKVFDIETGSNYLTLKEHTESVFTLKGGACGDRLSEPLADGGAWNHTLLSGSGDRTAILWDLRSGAPEMTFEGHEQAVFCADLCCDQGVLLTGSGDGKVRRFDLRTGHLRNALGPPHKDSIWGLAYNSLSRRCVTASVDRTVKTWDVLEGKMEHELECHMEPVMAIQADASCIVSGDSGGWLFVWSFEGGRQDCEYESLMSHVGPLM